MSFKKRILPYTIFRNNADERSVAAWKQKPHQPRVYEKLDLGPISIAPQTYLVVSTQGDTTRTLWSGRSLLKRPTSPS